MNIQAEAEKQLSIYAKVLGAMGVSRTAINRLIDDALLPVCEASKPTSIDPIPSSPHSLELDPKIGKWHLQFEDEEAWLEDSVSIRNLVFILCNQNRAICPTEINPVNGNMDVASNRKRVYISLLRFADSLDVLPLEKFNKEIERIVRRPDSFSYYPSVVWDRISPTSYYEV